MNNLWAFAIKEKGVEASQIETQSEAKVYGWNSHSYSYWLCAMLASRLVIDDTQSRHQERLSAHPY